MTSEIELFGKDSVKLNILKELTDGDINISLSLDGCAYQDYISQIHREDSRMQVLGKFNLSESPSGDLLTIRPIEVSEILKVTFGFSGNPFRDEKKLSVFRSKTKTVERQYDINDMLSSVEFIPQGNVNYLLRLTYGESESDESSVEPISHGSDVPSQVTSSAAVSDVVESLDDFDLFTSSSEAQVQAETEMSAVSEVVSRTQPDANSSENDPEFESIQGQIKAAEDKQKKLKERRASAKDLLKKLEAEYEKDYDEFQRELEEYKSQFGIDQSVIDYYRDNDIQPIEELMKEITEKITQAEQQISLVILGRQKKTMEIETQVKSNKQ